MLPTILSPNYPALMGGGAAVIPVLLIDDVFTDTNGVALSAHAIGPTNAPGAAWANEYSILEVQSNTAQIKAGQSEQYVLCDLSAGISDAIIYVKMLKVCAGVLPKYDCGIAVRTVGANQSGYYIGLTHSTVGLLRIVEQDATTGTSVVASTPVTIPDGVYELTVNVKGSIITATLTSPAATVSYNTATRNSTSTRFGVRLGRNAPQSYIDEFKLWTNP